MRRLVMLLAVSCLAGCAAAAAPGVEEMTTMAGTAFPAATGILATRSSMELNAANIDYIRAQAALLRDQSEELKLNRMRLQTERAATVGILRFMAGQRRDPIIADLALWVEAGGDPDFAMKYALANPASELKQLGPHTDTGRHSRSELTQ